MLPADCSRRLVAELQDALDSCAERQQQLDCSLRRCRRLLGTWKPAGPPAPESAQGPPANEDPPPASTHSPQDAKELELLTQALEKAVRVRKGVSKARGADGVTSAKPRTVSTILAATSAPGRARSETDSRSSEMRQPRGLRQHKVLTRGHPECRLLSTGDKKSSLGTGAPGKSLSLEDQQVTPAAALSGSEAFTLKDKGTLLRLPVAFQKAAAQNSRLWAQIDSKQAGDVENAAARKKFLQKMQAASGQSGLSTASEVRAELECLRRACSLLRLRMGDELETAPADWVQEYRCLLTLEGLQALAGQCLHRLQELQRVVAEQHLELPPRTSSLCEEGGGTGWSTPLLLYSSPRELQKLTALRLRVAMLDQQLHLEKVLMAELLPLVRVPGPPQVSLCRALYSLLCEGGERFPTALWDEPVD